MIFCHKAGAGTFSEGLIRRILRLTLKGCLRQSKTAVLPFYRTGEFVKSLGIKLKTPANGEGF
jgi:hypothetical protein